jgi:serine/threonine protein kinase HipA of HipAB toxin-antitoxin module
MPHAKNLSLLHSEDGGIQLAPIYDVFSTLFYPDADTTAAMFVNGLTL